MWWYFSWGAAQSRFLFDWLRTDFRYTLAQCCTVENPWVCFLWVQHCEMLRICTCSAKLAVLKCTLYLKAFKWCMFLKVLLLGPILTFRSLGVYWSCLIITKVHTMLWENMNRFINVLFWYLPVAVKKCCSVTLNMYLQPIHVLAALCAQFRSGKIWSNIVPSSVRKVCFVFYCNENVKCRL